MVRSHVSSFDTRKGEAMRKVILLAACILATTAATALAGSAHFIKNDTTVTRQGDSLVATFKVAGLGDENQIRVELSADAQCVNPGTQKPKAANKQSFSADGDFPVQNGRAQGTLTLTATFQPSCSPPMTVEYSNVQLVAYDSNDTADVSDDVVVATFAVRGSF